MNAVRTSTSAADDEGESALLTALRAGDEAAFATLVERHGGRMLAVARRILSHEDDAREAVQDAFLAAFRALPSFEGQSRLSTWLHRIAVNAALIKLRRRRTTEGCIDDLLPRFLPDGHHADPPAPWPESTEALLERRETRDLVRQAVDRLPETYRTVLLLRDIEGLETEETARLLEVTVGVVKTRLHRARQALRTLLDPPFRGGEI